MHDTVDILYIAWNRLQFTRWSFESLLRYTDWGLVRNLTVHDDGSTDGTEQYLREAVLKVPMCSHVKFRCGAHLGGPVAATNMFLLNDNPGDLFCKIDNDIILCDYWLSESLGVMNYNPKLGVLGFEYFDGKVVPGQSFMKHGEPEGSTRSRSYRQAPWVGGDNIMRTSLFDGNLPVANGRFGFTEWQQQHPEVLKGWITPHLPLFKVDLVPEYRYQALVQEYREKGWQRLMPILDPNYPEPWEWWARNHAD